MAVNTADKRSSAIHLGSPWRGMLPSPGTITQPDRQHVAFMYSGISSSTGGSPPAAVGSHIGQIATMNRWMGR